jgi:HSP20 family protein
MLEDTGKTIDSIKNDINQSIVDYTFVPGKDIIETDDTIIVRVDLAGIKKENIELNLTDTKLKVKAEFEDEHLGEMKGSNRRPTLIRRSVRFPKKVLPEEAEAKFENGLLSVEVPKLEKKESFRVDIK